MQPELTASILPIILVGVIGLMVGGVAGFVAAGLLASPPSEAAGRQGLVEQARVWRSRRQGRLVIEIDHQMIEDGAALSAGQRTRLHNLLAEVGRMTGLETLTPPPPPAATGAASKAPPSVGAPRPVNLPSSGAEASHQGAFPANKPPSGAGLPPSGLDLDALRSAALAATAPDDERPAAPGPRPLSPVRAEPPTPPSLDISDIVANAFTPRKTGKEPPAPPKSIAAQVDEIVQERLPDSPFRKQVITVHDHDKKGIVVLVDGVEYDGINDVADAGVRAFLQECVRVWEQRG